MKELKASAEIKVRFSEVDSMNIVWHGNYVKYFEDARIAFGEKYNIGYLDMFAQGFYAPIVKMDFKFVNPLIFGDTFIAEAVYKPCEGAKLMFDYNIRRKSDNELVATGSTTQVFLDLKYKLVLYSPEFYIIWKKKYVIE